jgi:hypothetical protein
VKDQFIGCRICKNVEVLTSDQKKNTHILSLEKMPRHVQWKRESESAINSNGKRKVENSLSESHSVALPTRQQTQAN